MRHRVATRRLGRPTDQRLAILKNLVAALIDHEHVTTTEARAKEVRPIIEKVITLAREDSVTNRRMARRYIPMGKAITTKEKYENVHGEALSYALTPKTAGGRPRELKGADRRPKGELLLKKLFDEIGPRFKERNGGYVRLTRLGGESHASSNGKTVIRPARRGDNASMVRIELLD